MLDLNIEAVTKFADEIAYYEGGIYLVEFRDYTKALVINDEAEDEVYVFDESKEKP